ncbi:MAG: hypothetical protein ACI8ZM_004864 [Crocinitomix sp.]|jgi:hypothetical protein
MSLTIKHNTYHIFPALLLIMFFNSCDTNSIPNEPALIDADTLPPNFNQSPKTVDSIIPNIRTKPADFDAFAVLRKITQEERGPYYKGRKDYTSIEISNPDSIETFSYITNLFPAEDIDQLIYNGKYPLNKGSKIHMRIGALLSIKFKEKNKENEALQRLYAYQPDDQRAITDIYKPGGMAFILENQLCLYSVNTCSGGYKNLQRIDSIIFRYVFYNEDFERLHTICGMQPFKKLID